MYSNTFVQTGLINGTQWDTILKWFQHTGYTIANSGTWGNHYNSSLALREGKYAYYSSNYGGSWRTSYQLKKFKDNYDLIKTGASHETRANNIYDLAGNLWEWTSETYSNSSIRRGGSVGYSSAVNPVSYRGHYHSEEERYWI